jgi:aminoglycoside phosphotransferase (APT) family kinase protein
MGRLWGFLSRPFLLSAQRSLTWNAISMHLDHQLIDVMFSSHGIAGPWVELPSTGVANRIFATEDVVLRVATDHPEAVPDARTESVAAPVARAAGVMTPRLIAFDDTRTLIARPFSLWERVHGETLGAIELSPHLIANVWRSVGGELAKLHTRVRACADPNEYLDQPGRDQDVGAVLNQLVAAQKVDADAAQRIDVFARELQERSAPEVESCFVHDDLHPMNIMCSATGELMAILDWGDAGWGDPALDFATMPLEAIAPALAGYEAETARSLSARFVARVAWYKLLDAVDELSVNPKRPLDLEALRRILPADGSRPVFSRFTA